MTYQITRITPLSEPRPMGNCGRMIVAEFTVTFGPVTLLHCALTHRVNHGFRVALPSQNVKMENAVRNEIKARVKNACFAAVGQ